jgi:hypothetical protein
LRPSRTTPACWMSSSVLSSRPGDLAGPRGEGREGPAGDHRSPITPQRLDRHLQPLYEQARRAAGLDNDWELPLPATQGRRR